LAARAKVVTSDPSRLLAPNAKMLLSSPQACLGGGRSKFSDQAITTLLVAGCIAFLLKLIITRQTTWDDCEYDSKSSRLVDSLTQRGVDLGVLFLVG
jgi:hypothetical protein